MKEGAIPFFVSDVCPAYLQPTLTAARESPSRKRQRLEDSFLQQAKEASIAENDEYQKRVTFSNLKELSNCLEEQNIDDFWTTITKDNCIMILHVTNLPEILCCLKVNEDLNVSVIHKKTQLKKLGTYEFPLKVCNINILCDILSCLKLLNVSDAPTSDEDFKTVFDTLICLFQKLKSIITDDSNLKFINFVMEQLTNMNVGKQQRRYSTDFLIMCSLIKSISPHCYKFIRNSEFFILPHESTLRRICSEFGVDPSKEQHNVNFLSYIRQKFSCLEEKEKFVTLMIDEIHIKSNFDYVGGKLLGMSFNDTYAATSAFVFMIQSFLSSYKDVAHILPVNSLTAEMFHAFIKKVIIGLEVIGFNVIVLVTDNNAINKKAVSLFSSPPQLCVKYENPACPERDLFFLFDSVHILKCVRNNWINQKNPGTCMFYPDFNDLSLFNTASFQALKKLHEIESGKLLKYSYGLTEKALSPTSFERQNVKLALQVINSVVAEGLELVGEEEQISHYKQTAEYIKIIFRWWSIMNVKTLYKGEHKRDEFQKPLTPNTDTPSYKFLHDFIKWLEMWEKMNCTTGGLTKQTHLAITHTSKTMLALAEYCFLKLKFNYFLPGKIQTDLLEDRFGSYRMLAGSNYNISIRQVYETEAKLRIQSILPILLKSKNDEEFLQNFFHDKELDECPDYLDSYPFIRNFIISPRDLVNTETSLPIVTYISGYAAHSIIKKLKCEQCCSSLIIDKPLDIDINNNWISKLDRGGLKYPHPDVVCVSQFTYAVVNKLLCSTYEEEFMNCTNHKQLVKLLTLDVLQENNIFIGINECQYHESSFLMNKIVSIFVNILLNNFCKKQNDAIQKKKNSKKETTQVKKSKAEARKLSTLK